MIGQFAREYTDPRMAELDRLLTRPKVESKRERTLKTAAARDRAGRMSRVRQTAALARWRNHWFSTPCFVCGAMQLCSHRELELLP